MATITKPVMTDETGQGIITAIQGISLGNYVVVNVNNYTWGSVTGGGLYPPNTQVTLTATPKSGCYFLAWMDANNNILSTNSVYQFTPTANVVIQARFNADEFVEIVSWANGTELQLNAMLDAHYRGVIDIHDYWSVGDTRTVHINAIPNASTDGTVAVMETHVEQDTEWTLMATDCDYISLTDTASEYAFIVGMKNSLIRGGTQTETSHYSSGVPWATSSRYGWCKKIFPESLPTVFRGMFKEFQLTLTGDWSSFTAYFSIPNFKMITTSPLTWYATAENRIKKKGINGIASDYWAYAGATYMASYGASTKKITSAGVESSQWGNSELGLSLFGCI